MDAVRLVGGSERSGGECARVCLRVHALQEAHLSDAVTCRSGDGGHTALISGSVALSGWQLRRYSPLTWRFLSDALRGVSAAVLSVL